ncbi:MAG: acetate/propionate family kinase [Propionibacteriaceae bacterium]|nr:acetate/propionate family kinase [Propionibacteriaceae bacterium]
MATQQVLVVRIAFGAIKYALIDASDRTEHGHGKAHGISTAAGEVLHTVAGHTFEVENELPDYETALNLILKMIHSHCGEVEISAVAHRVMHGADLFTQPTLIDDEVIVAIERLAALAPSHNLAAAEGIRAAMKLLPDLPHVAIFDTAFFHDLPPEVSTYALPEEITKKLHIRKYGFHGTTHAYVSERVSLLLGHDEIRQIVCYLGKGSSISAVAAGRPIEVSTGLSSIEGLPMRSRSGMLDPGIHNYVVSQTGMSLAEFTRILTENSGLYGMTGHTDMRKIWAAADAGDERSNLAIDLITHRIVSYIAAYHGVLGGAQAISFTGSIGENDYRLRKKVCDRLECIGVEIDTETNARTNSETTSRIISVTASEIPILMVHQRDAVAMARQTAELLGWGSKNQTPPTP